MCDQRYFENLVHSNTKQSRIASNSPKIRRTAENAYVYGAQVKNQEKQLFR